MRVSLYLFDADSSVISLMACVKKLFFHTHEEG